MAEASSKAEVVVGEGDGGVFECSASKPIVKRGE